MTVGCCTSETSPCLCLRVAGRVYRPPYQKDTYKNETNNLSLRVIKTPLYLLVASLQEVSSAAVGSLG